MIFSIVYVIIIFCYLNNKEEYYENQIVQFFISVFVAFAMMISLIMVKIPVEGITTSTSVN